MGNVSTASAKGALAVANAKNKLGKTFSGESDTGTKSINENPETKLEQLKRHQQREEE
jgi:hypothetical protein